MDEASLSPLSVLRGKKILQMHFFSGGTQYGGALRKCYKIFDHESLKAKSERWSFKESYCFFSLLLIVVNSVTCTLECNTTSDIYSEHYYIVDMLFNALFVLVTVIRYHDSGLKYFGAFIAILELIAGMGSLFDFIEIGLFGHSGRALSVRWIVVLILPRVIGILMSASSESTGPRMKILFLRTIVGTVGILCYSIAFVLVLSLISALLVVSDVLPVVSILKHPDGIAWTPARSLLGSVTNGIYSMLQISTLDDWYSDFARPLFEAGLWLPGSVVFLLVFSSNMAYSSVVLGCIVDRSTEIAREISETRNTSMEARMDIYRGNLITAMNQMIAQRPGTKLLHFSSFELFISGCDQHFNVSRILRLLGLESSEIIQTFKSLDLDIMQGISLKTFSEALPRLKLDARGQDLIHINALLTRTHSQTECVSLKAAVASDLALNCEKDAQALQNLLAGFYTESQSALQRREKDALRVRNRKKISRLFTSLSGQPT